MLWLSLKVRVCVFFYLVHGSPLHICFHLQEAHPEFHLRVPAIVSALEKKEVTSKVAVGYSYYYIFYYGVASLQFMLWLSLKVRACVFFYLVHGPPLHICFHLQEAHPEFHLRVPAIVSALEKKEVTSKVAVGYSYYYIFSMLYIIIMQCPFHDFQSIVFLYCYLYLFFSLIEL
jgi:hypothetical protein